MTLGRTVLTFILVIQSIAGFVLDWRSNHLLSPLWHPHARFHDALLLFMLTGVSLMGVWLLWRESEEPQVAITVAAVISFSFWTPFFYITFFLPSSSLWAGNPAAVPHLGSMVFYPNLAVAALFLILTAAAWYISLRGSTSGASGTG